MDWLPSTTYTPTQDGSIERARRVIIQQAIAIRIVARLPEVFWPEAMTAAAYLHNISLV